MDVIRTGNRNIVTMRITSPQLWVLPTHWDPANRRTVLCPADRRCPLCTHTRPKHRGYAIGRMKEDAAGSTIGLIELCSEIVTQLTDHGLNQANAAGWTWRMQRREHRPGWKVLGALQHDDPEVSAPELLPLALETLYGLPPANDPADEGPETITDRTAWATTYSDALLRRIIATTQRSTQEAHR